MYDNLIFTSLSTADNSFVGKTDDLEKENTFKVNKLRYRTHSFSGRQLFLFVLIFVFSVVCISVITTVVTANIMKLTVGDTGLLGAKGLVGDKGEVGDTGLPGAKGQVGDKGEVGDTGLPGAKGQVGDKGEVGDTGLQGAKGPIGDKGEIGDTGLPGAKGQVGEKGEVGDTELPSAKGQVGEKGEVGETGLPGAKGQVGEMGDVGDTGLPGLKGPVGDKGEVGDSGLTGDKGQPGSKGPIGDKGLAGEKGSKGEMGFRGFRGNIGQKGQKGSRASERDCGSGWMLLGRYCYLFNSSRDTWQGAQSHCRLRGGNLVKIENAMEDLFLQVISKQSQLGAVWIGVNDLNLEGHMQWVSDNTNVSNGFSNWAPREPSNYGGMEDCVSFWPGKSYKWNDAGCDARYAFICKK